MEVMVGSSFGVGMAACVRDRGGVSAQDKAVPPPALFMADEPGRGGAHMRNESAEESSEDNSSSIGEISENEEEDDVVLSQKERGALDSFTSSLEDSLPIKRGLSNHYVGKSKSFGNLMEASKISAKDLEKVENPFNKKRRLLIANKLKSRGRSMSVSNFYTWQNPSSMPLVVLQEPNKVGADGDDQTMKLFERRKMMMKSKKDLMAQTQSCFCLSSLQEEDDDGCSGDDNE